MPIEISLAQILQELSAQTYQTENLSYISEYTLWLFTGAKQINLVLYRAMDV